MPISVVINTLNSAKTLRKCLASVKDFDQIVVVDMHSDDQTLAIAHEFKAEVYQHERTGFVEPARNFALSKATNDWILILDSDEEISPNLKQVLTAISEGKYPANQTHFYLPRKNIIFGEWIEHAGWWPDHIIRFFKKGTIEWLPEIHSEPKILSGESFKVPAEEQYAIIHHNYTTISEWIQRMDRYTTIQAEEKISAHYIFNWRDLIRQPLSEFLRRFFVWEGWKDGISGLGLCLLQSLSEVVVYLKIRERQPESKQLYDGKDNKFLKELNDEFERVETETGHYLESLGLQSQLKRWIQRVLP